MSDLKFAFRQLLKNPGFTAVAVLTLAICLGANLTILTVVDAILVRALPFAEPDRLAVIYNRFPGAGIDRIDNSIASYFERRDAIKAFESVSVYRESSVIVDVAGSPRRVPILSVSPEFFATLGVPLALGQAFTDENLTWRRDEVAILTDGFWRSHFNADPNVIGRTFDNDGARISVIGVLPRGFRFLSSRAQFFRPASHDPKDRSVAQRHANLDLHMVARLAPGVSWSVAQAQMNAFNAQQLENDPLKEVVRKAGFQTTVASLHEDHVHSVKRTLVLLQVGVGFLLLIGVVNLANLLLIRANGRAQEFAVRQALGAGRWQIARGVSAEVMLLVLSAATIGLLLSVGGLRVLSALGADQLLGETIHLDARTATAGFSIAMVVGGLLTLLLLGFNLSSKLAAGLKLGTRSGSANRGSQRLYHGFVVAQVALAFVLLSGAGFLGISLKRVLETPVGFNPSNVLSGRIAFPWIGYTNQPVRLAFVDRLLAEVGALPGVSHVAANTLMPFSADSSENAVVVEGREMSGDEGFRSHDRARVTSAYWQALDIPLLRGRLLEDADRHRQPRACVVDEAVAKLYWPNEDPIGRRITFGAKFDPGDSFAVVGMVAVAKQTDIAERSDKGMIYVPYGVNWPDSFSLVVRSALPEAALAPMLRRAVAQCDPGMPLDDLRSLQSRIDDSLVARRSPAVLAGLFAGVALLLASLGTYGVLAYAVSQRQREIGVRMALGAQPTQVLKQFFGFGAKLCLIGLGIGMAGAWAAARAMQSMLFGVGAFPLGVILAASLSLAGVVLVAVFLPSRRASRVDPMVALRNE